MTYEFGVGVGTSTHTPWIQRGTSTVDILLKLECAFIISTKDGNSRVGSQAEIWPIYMTWTLSKVWDSFFKSWAWPETCLKTYIIMIPLNRPTCLPLDRPIGQSLQINYQINNFNMLKKESNKIKINQKPGSSRRDINSNSNNILFILA